MTVLTLTLDFMIEKNNAIPSSCPGCEMPPYSYTVCKISRVGILRTIKFYYDTALSFAEADGMQGIAAETGHLVAIERNVLHTGLR